MFDIDFYMKIFDLKKRVMQGEKFDREFLLEKFEEYRSPNPVVYNIETTNACNMRCEMCPRTTMMTRPIETMTAEIFSKVISQLRPWSPEKWETWQKFIEEKYAIDRNDISENHFFLHVIPKVIVLHGYGDPLLDKNIPDYVELMTKQGLISYFSCNPANINMERTIETFENGLNYVKYSIESVDDLRHKEVRGLQSNFTESYKKILQLLEIKAQRNLENGHCHNHD